MKWRPGDQPGGECSSGGPEVEFASTVNGTLVHAQDPWIQVGRQRCAWGERPPRERQFPSVVSWVKAPRGAGIEAERREKLRLK